MTIDDKIRYMIYSYAKKRANGFSRVDYRDIAQEACVRVLSRTKPVEDRFIPIYLKRTVGNTWNEHYARHSTRRKEVLDEAGRFGTCNTPSGNHPGFDDVDMVDTALSVVDTVDEVGRNNLFDSVRYHFGVKPKGQSKTTFYNRRNKLCGLFEAALMGGE